MEAYQLSDEERVELALINGATKGDNETLGELFDRYQPLVRRLWLNCSIAQSPTWIVRTGNKRPSWF